MSDTQHSSDDSLRRLFLQLHQPATGANFEQEVMRKIRIAELKKRESKLWEVKATLIAAAAAVLIAAAAWAAIAAIGEQHLFFDAIRRQLAHLCAAGAMLLLRDALSQKEIACLMLGLAVVTVATALSNRKKLRFND
jgi:hypothetical protein